MKRQTIERLKEVENAILLIDVSKGDTLNQKSKRQALELLREVIQEVGRANERYCTRSNNSNSRGSHCEV